MSVNSSISHPRLTRGSYTSYFTLQISNTILVHYTASGQYIAISGPLARRRSSVKYIPGAMPDPLVPASQRRQAEQSRRVSNALISSFPDLLTDDDDGSIAQTLPMPPRRASRLIPHRPEPPEVGQRRPSFFGFAMPMQGTSDSTLTSDESQASPEHAFLVSHVTELGRLHTLRAQIAATNAFESNAYSQGAVILDTGAFQDSLFVVKSGEFAAYARIVDEGNTPLYVYKEGECMCERALQRTAVSQYTIRCLKDGELLCFLGEDYRQLLDRSHEFINLDDPIKTLTSLDCCKSERRADLELLSSLTDRCECESLESLASAFEAHAADEDDVIIILQTGTLSVQLTTASTDEATANDTRAGTGPDPRENTVTVLPGEVLGRLAIRVIAKSLRRQANENERESKRRVSLLVLGQKTASSVPQPLRLEASRSFKRKIVQSIECFRTMKQKEIDAIIDAGWLERVSAGSRISSEGEKHDGFYIVFEGTARASRRSRSQTVGLSLTAASTGGSVERPTSQQLGDDLTIGYFRAGDHFGGVCILNPAEPRKVSVTAVTNMLCLVLSRSILGPFLERLKHFLARELSHRQWLLDHRGQIRMDDLTFGATIGEGTFGRVKVVKHMQTAKVCALKILSKLHLIADEQVEHIGNERTILALCNHPFLLRMVGAFQGPSNVFLILELIPGGELLGLLRLKKAFGTSQARFYAGCVVSALAYLNSLSIVYRDIKPENIMLDDEGYAKIVDMGFAKVLSDKAFTFCGTPDYMPIEMVQCKSHGLPADWWSVGILIYEMMIGKAPFTSEKMSTTFCNILRYAETERLAFPWLFNWWAADLIGKLLSCNPNSRPAAGEVMAHGFFSGLDFLALEQRLVAAPFIPDISASHDEFFEEADIDDSDDEDEADDYSPRIVEMAKRVPFTGFAFVENPLRKNNSKDLIC